MRDAGHSQSDTGQAAHRKLYGLLLASAVVLLGCGSTTAPVPNPGNTTASPSAAPLEVSLSVTQMDESVCRIEVTAVTRGGEKGAYAVWQELEGRAYDAITGEFIGIRTLQLYPGVFDADRINAGQTQWGTLDLELFRREAGDPVIVDLEFYYSAVENGEYLDRMVETTHSCL